MRNSSYNLIPILLKLSRHCDHALRYAGWDILLRLFFVTCFFTFFFFFFGHLKVTYQLGA